MQYSSQKERFEILTNKSIGFSLESLKALQFFKIEENGVLSIVDLFIFYALVIWRPTAQMILLLGGGKRLDITAHFKNRTAVPQVL